MRYLFVPWTIVAVYSILSFAAGQNGVLARLHVESEYQRLEENRQSLAAAQRNSLRAKETLLTDDDALSVHARRLGFGSRDESFVRVVGVGVTASSGIAAPSGQVLHAIDPDFLENHAVLTISMILGALVLLFFLINDLYWLKAGRE